MNRPEELLVHCRGAGRAYGPVRAVVDVTCSIRRCDRIALTGRSGSGKSSLLYLLAGLERPTSGTVDRSARCAVVFQGPSLHTDLDVVENVALGAVLADADESTAFARAVDALTALGIADLAGHSVGTLSAGQAQRVAVARVLAARPDLILADEPTGHLDRAAAGRVLGVLTRTADVLDAGLLVATHDEAVAGTLRRRWSMTDGRLVRSDDLRATGEVRR